MSSKAEKRLQQDLKKVIDDPPAGVCAGLCKENIFAWDATVFGPAGTCYEGGTFRLKLKFPKDYPQSPPQVWFYSHMFHPNVYPDGKICLDILQVGDDKWKPEYDACNVLVGIQTLLGAPNPNSPANAEASHLYETNRTEYELRVRQIVSLSLDDDVSGRNYNLDDKIDLSFLEDEAHDLYSPPVNI